MIAIVLTLAEFWATEWVNLAALGNQASGQSPAALCLPLPPDSWMTDPAWKIKFLTLCITKAGASCPGLRNSPRCFLLPAAGAGGLLGGF